MQITVGLVNLVSYLSYFVTMLILLLVAGYAYVRFTPLDELALIREGNVAAAIMLGGAMIGFGLVFYSSATHSANLLDTVLWSVISLVVQIVAFELVRGIMYALHDDWQTKIKEGDIAHGVFFGCFSLTIGIINAACVT